MIYLVNYSVTSQFGTTKQFSEYWQTQTPPSLPTVQGVWNYIISGCTVSRLLVLKAVENPNIRMAEVLAF